MADSARALCDARSALSGQALSGEEAFYPLDDAPAYDSAVTYPTLIYDGPFSDARETGAARGLGDRAVTAEEAWQIARDFVGADRVIHLSQGADMGGSIPCWGVTLELKDVTLEAAIPFGDQPGRWDEAQRRRYNSLIDRADKVTVLQIGYTSDCMMQRNRYMVDRSSLLLACFDGRPGGTMNTILYAERSGVKTVVIEVE